MMQLTNEQCVAVEAFTRGERLRLIAYAGAGKTSTLRAMAFARPKVRGLYMAFNKAIAAESQSKFAGSAIDCRTAHSLAYRWAAGHGYASQKLTGRLDVRSVEHVATVPELGRSPRWGKRMALATLRKWMQSADDDITATHLPLNVKEETSEFIIDQACFIWSAMVANQDSAPLSHDGYLKLWASTRPILPYDLIMVDEAQDLNPVVIGLLSGQSVQLISVGDPHQQIYAWRGAVDALRILPGLEMRLTQSFRFGGEVADLANGLLVAMGEHAPLRGNGRAGFVGPLDSEPDAILCRTNAGVFAAAEHHPGCAIAGGVGELTALIADVERLRADREPQGIELAAFRNWAEVLEACGNDELGSLAPFVRMVERRGVGELRKILERTSDSGGPVIGTAHKTKGLEWSAVEVHPDFGAEEPSIEERRLFYVACTRAVFELGVNQTVTESYLKAWQADENNL
jgi:hypothetical protein